MSLFISYQNMNEPPFLDPIHHKITIISVQSNAIKKKIFITSYPITNYSSSIDIGLKIIDTEESSHPLFRSIDRLTRLSYLYIDAFGSSLFGLWSRNLVLILLE
jgi:hypothetical protein